MTRADSPAARMTEHFILQEDASTIQDTVIEDSDKTKTNRLSN